MPTIEIDNALILGLISAIYALVVLLFVTGVYVIATLKRDNSVMDIAYGPAYAVGAWTTLILTDTMSILTLVIAGCITMWAVRLSLRIGKKNWGKPEDQRYAAWRNAWMQKGHWYFLVRSYLQINLLQGVIIVIVSLPFIIAVAAYAQSTTELITPFMYAGVAIWLIGFLFESIADWQLDQFIARKKAGAESKTLMTSGLFRYSRRPNYFGESLVWWGLAIAVLPLPYGYLALLSPLLITFILTRVTGPMLEDIFLEKNPQEYRHYMSTTSYFIPWWPKI